MKKTLIYVLGLTVSGMALAAAETQTNVSISEKYQLDNAKNAQYQMRAQNKTTADDTNKNLMEKSITPKIITEEIPGGKIEKLLDQSGKVVAEKTIKSNKITNKTLNYYYPDGKLMRKVIAADDDSGFYAEEYYTNGKLAGQSKYLNELNKIGIERKYDANGTLRQEIPWELIKIPDQNNWQQTRRYGNVVTYYPNGKKAAVFPVGKPGKTIFYNLQEQPIKEIENSQILNFPKEMTEEDCQGKTIHLGLQSLVELYEDEGDISYNKCGMPYRENFLYEIEDRQGEKSTVLSFDETGMIRRLTPYINGLRHGIMQKFDAAGNITAEIPYQEGGKNGEAKGYFPTKEIAFRKQYVQGKVEGKMTCFFPTGEIAAEFFYQNGLKQGQAKINSPIKKDIQFKDDKIVDMPENNTKRQMVSLLSLAPTQEQQCLDIKDKIHLWQSQINQNQIKLQQTFSLTIPQGCENIASFKNEEDNLLCLAADNKILAEIPAAYSLGKQVEERVYDRDKNLQYLIPYFNQKRQGWAKVYNNEKQIIAEMYYNKGELSGNSRSYFPNGQVKEILSYADDAPQNMMARYNDQGALQFSLTSTENRKKEAYLSIPAEQKEITIHYYEDKAENIKEGLNNEQKTVIEYNLALGEYVVYENDQLTKVGKLCGYEPSDKIQVINIQPDSSKIAKQTDTLSPHEISLPEPPVLSAEDAPMIEDGEELGDLDKLVQNSLSDYNNKQELHQQNDLISMSDNQKKTELAAQNIGPITKPNIEKMADVVQKQKISTVPSKAEEDAEPKTEKLYYANGNLRKTIKTKGTRTQEIKEYSKNGLLLTDVMYNRDKILIEKYFGTGEVRRKTEKSYDDNAVLAFISREDFYDSGNQRYEIKRQPNTMLFSEKVYYPDGTVKSATTQNTVLSFFTEEYDKNGNLLKETEEQGEDVLIREYGPEKKLQKVTLNGKEVIPENAKIKEKSLIYDRNGKLAAAFMQEKNHNTLLEYYANGQIKTEIIFYANGEISIKEFAGNKELIKFAYLAYDGKLHIEKPARKIIPAYRERHWVDYNNPKWIENQDKYSIRSIARLNLDVAAHMLKEMNMPELQMLKRLRAKY